MKEILPNKSTGHCLEKLRENTIYSPDLVAKTILASGVYAASKFDQNDFYVQAGILSAIVVGLITLQCGRTGLRSSAINAIYNSVDEFDENKTKASNCLYKSLDGSIEITEASELLSRIGSPQVAAKRLGIILMHAKIRNLKENEIEKLRLIQAGLSLVPDIQTKICDPGKEMIEEMKMRISDYEIKRGKIVSSKIN